MYVVGKRAPAHITPRSTGAQSVNCGAIKAASPDAPAPCGLNYDELRAVGMYCPTMAERTYGILTCACFSQVYLDGRLMNTAHPTEPFDANTIPVDDIEGVEFYASAASTPGRYSSLNAQCGVMLVWTRR